VVAALRQLSLRLAEVRQYQQTKKP